MTKKIEMRMSGFWPIAANGLCESTSWANRKAGKMTPFRRGAPSRGARLRNGAGPSSTGALREQEGSLASGGLVRPGAELLDRLVGERARLAPLDGRAQVAHQVQVEGQVVQAVQAEAEQLLRGEEVAQVGAGEGAAGVAGAGRVGRPRVPGIARALDLQAPLPGEEQPVAGDPRWQHAVGEVGAGEGAAQEVLPRPPPPHGARLAPGGQPGGRLAALP